MTWIQKDNRNLNITNSNSTGTFMSHAIRHRPAPINSKIYVLQSALIPRLTYTSQFVPPTPLQLESMDKKILKWGRQILRLTPIFPAAVLSSRHLL